MKKITKKVYDTRPVRKKKGEDQLKLEKKSDRHSKNDGKMKRQSFGNLPKNLERNMEEKKPKGLSTYIRIK